MKKTELKKTKAYKDCAYLLRLLEVTSRQELTPCERAVFMLYGTTLDFYQSVVVTIGKRDAEKAFERIVKLFAAYEVLPKLEDKELLLSLPLRFHNFSPRLYHSLKSKGCETLGEVVNLTEKSLLRARGYGEAQHNELLKYLRKCNVWFRRKEGAK